MRSVLLVLTLALSTSLAYAHVEPAERVSGAVTDQQGGAVARATLTLSNADRTFVVSATTDAQGRFTIDRVPSGTYVLTANAPLLAESRRTISVGAEPVSELKIVLAVAGASEEVTVTATRSAAEDTTRVGQPVNIVTRAELDTRVKTVVGQAVEGETGVALQRTSPTMAGIFVRGLTGNKVNIFVDGVRYSNGAQRGGVNTFLDLIDPASLDSIEILRGPSSSQYGSDALGGSVQFLTKAPSLYMNGSDSRATVSASAGTAHRNGGLDGTWGYSRAGFGLTATGSGRRVGLLRPGQGIDSHAAVTRFLGVPSDLLMDERLPDTDFDQWGASLRANWMATPSTHVVASYFRSDQDRGKRYDQLLGGDGNLVSELNGLSLDLFYARVERLDVGPFDSLSVTYSLNSQREERVNQGGNGNPTAAIGHEPERTTVHGLQSLVAKQLSDRASLSFGGDVFFEKLTSDSFNINPVTGAESVRRPRVPDQATFVQGGVFAQTAYDVQPDRVRLVGSVRVGGASYEARAADAPIVGGQPLWPDDSLSVGNVTFRAGAVFTPRPEWTFNVSASRGFRAPHMTDLGTLGLTGSGFEVAAPDVSGLNAQIGSTADGAAVTTGNAVEQLTPESSLNYEGSARYRRSRVDTELTLFANNVYDNIQKVALILPQGAVGQTLGGTPITSQNPNGAVFVAATTVPVLVRANFDNARIWGIEHTARVKVTSQVSAQSAFTYLHARDTGTDLPPNIEGGTPAPQLWLSAQYTSADGRWWVQPYTQFGWEQSRLSSLDLGDRRTGSGRSRNNIQAFFRNGATARGWVTAGRDGAFGTADDILTATGETLAQIQDRVLGPGVNSNSLFPAIPGYQTYGLRGGMRFGAHELIVDLENLNDENYRGLSWGVDAPGRGVSARFVARF